VLLLVSVYVTQGNHKCSEVRCLSLHYRKLLTIVKYQSDWICDSDFRLGYNNIIQSNPIDGANSSNSGISSVYVGI
jgi:hypothetical protein